jgi:hypothetical protein
MAPRAGTKNEASSREVFRSIISRSNTNYVAELRLSFHRQSSTHEAFDHPPVPVVSKNANDFKGLKQHNDLLFHEVKDDLSDYLEASLEVMNEDFENSDFDLDEHVKCHLPFLFININENERRSIRQQL